MYMCNTVIESNGVIVLKVLDGNVLLRSYKIYYDGNVYKADILQQVSSSS